VGDKSPNGLLDGEAVRLAQKIYPDGKIIFIVRDGRDAAVSHRFQTFIDATQHLNEEDWAIRDAFENDPEPFLNGKRSIFTKKGIYVAAQGWAKNVLETDELGGNIFGEQYISLRYEDMLAHPWEQISRLWDFLKVDTNLPELKSLIQAELSSNPDNDWQRQKAGELVSPLEKGKSGSWKKLFTERDQTVFRDVAGEALKTWNYQW
jgi:hypothetical protein